MRAAPKKAMGLLLILLGATTVIFSRTIVFPGLERFVGIETIVGKANVVYLPDRGYGFTNPSAMMRWISTVAAIGITICLSGIWLLVRASKDRKNSH